MDPIESHFHMELQRSNSPAHTAFWHQAHERSFKGFQSMTSVTDLTLQSQGLDRIITTDTRTLTVEEKLDETPYPNIAFEVWSTRHTHKGWALKDLQADIFAYGFKHSGTVYYFTTTSLLAAFREHQPEWTSKYGERTVWNSKAVVLPVPITVVLSHVQHHVTHVSH